MPPIDPARLLAGAEAAFSHPEETAETIRRALDAAPDDPQVHLAAYRFYFYTHDYRAATKAARAVLQHAARRLNVAPDWADVAPGDAEFTALDHAPGLYLQALIGLGYCAARSGQRALARAALAKSAALDPSDRFGGAWLLSRIDAGATEDDDPAADGAEGA